MCSDSAGVSLLRFVSPDCSGTGALATIPDPFGVFSFSCRVTQSADAGDAIHFYGNILHPPDYEL